MGIFPFTQVSLFDIESKVKGLWKEPLGMDAARKLGILVFCAVPAIIGGGIVYFASDSLTAVAIYEILLLAAAGAFVSR